MNELSELLKDIRKHKKDSLRTASKGIGISHSYLDSLEKGYDARTKKERKPTPDVLRKISNYYNIPYVTLMSVAGYVNNDGAVEVDSFRDMFPPSHGKGTITALNEQGQFEQASVGAGGVPDYSNYNYLDIYDIVTKTDNVLYRKNELSEEDKEVLISILDGKFINEDNQDG